MAQTEWISRKHIKIFEERERKKWVIAWNRLFETIDSKILSKTEMNIPEAKNMHFYVNEIHFACAKIIDQKWTHFFLIASHIWYGLFTVPHHHVHFTAVLLAVCEEEICINHEMVARDVKWFNHWSKSDKKSCIFIYLIIHMCVLNFLVFFSTEKKRKKKK